MDVRVLLVHSDKHFPLIIFIIYKPEAVWCTVTDYHNNDGAQWMVARWKKNTFYQMDETRPKTGIGVGELVELQKHYAVYDLL